MAEISNVKIYGLKEMEDALKSMSKQLGGKEGRPVNNALNAARRSVLKRAKENAPIKTGRLRNAIVNIEERHPEYYSVVKYVGVRKGKTRADENGAWYAPFVEFKGGKGGEGKGFMQRAINPEVDGRIYAKSLAGGVERLAKKIGDENARKLAAQVRKAHTVK